MLLDTARTSNEWVNTGKESCRCRLREPFRKMYLKICQSAISVASVYQRHSSCFKIYGYSFTVCVSKGKD